MAARTVTTFTHYIDEDVLVPRKTVTTTEPSKVTDDQQFVLEIERLLIGDVFYPLRTNSGSATRLRRYYLTARDMCGVASSESCEYAILAWANDGSTNFEVGIENITRATSTNIAVSSSLTSKNWRGFATGGSAAVLDTAGTETEIAIHARTTSGSGYVYVGGVALFSAS